MFPKLAITVLPRSLPFWSTHLLITAEAGVLPACYKLSGLETMKCGNVVARLQGHPKNIVVRAGMHGLSLIAAFWVHQVLCFPTISCTTFCQAPKSSLKEIQRRPLHGQPDHRTRRGRRRVKPPVEPRVSFVQPRVSFVQSERKS